VVQHVWSECTFTTTRCFTPSTYSLARLKSEKVRNSAVGMLFCCMKCLDQALLASMRAAAALGPNAAMPCVYRCIYQCIAVRIIWWSV